MTGWLLDFQYRILKSISPGEPAHADGSIYLGKSKLRTLLGERAIAELAGKTVIDFGCGEGKESIELAQSGVARVVGLDIREAALETARQRAAAAGVGERCAFSTRAAEPVDAIVSLDAFEHFADPASVLRTMHALLRAGGFALIEFGYPWLRPYGGHLFSVFPWAHVIFSERALIRWRSDIRSDGATRFSEVEGGLNRMTVRRFERLVYESPFHAEWLELVPIRRLAAIHCRLTREFTTSVVRCRLRGR